MKKKQQNDWLFNLLTDMLLVHIEDIVKDNRYAREAEKWVFSDSPDYRLQFSDVCAVLGLDYQLVRQHIRRMMDERDRAGEIEQKLREAYR